MKNEFLTISGKKFKSRLIVGTGKYRNLKETREAVLASNS